MKYLIIINNRNIYIFFSYINKYNKQIVKNILSYYYLKFFY